MRSDNKRIVYAATRRATRKELRSLIAPHARRWGIMNKATQANDMLAHRDLEFVHAAGEREPVRVSIVMPVPGELEDQWWCECVIEGKSFRKTFRIAGGDPIHALTLALTTIAEELERLSQRYNGEFHFLGEVGHGFLRFADR